jgi:hypothetical protein
MSGHEIMREVRSEIMHNYVDGDAKTNFTFCSSIGALRSRLLLILIAGGTTEMCHKQFDDNYQHEIWHSVRGCSTESLMER